MISKTALETADSVLRDLTDSPFLFGGKHSLFGGDFRQIFPVIRRGSSMEMPIGYSFYRVMVMEQQTTTKIESLFQKIFQILKISWMMC
uniref:ATP-dependent DNA helicase n=1 Tax=Caenorhabditis japonica TaxID=281687 RepID=A0A8R1ECC7_CAEJA